MWQRNNEFKRSIETGIIRERRENQWRIVATFE